MSTVEQHETKELLMRAGEVLFARAGIAGARIREINELAGQRNPSALHYHFGSRDGLVVAILRDHQVRIDAQVAPALDRLEREGRLGDPRAVIESICRPMVEHLDTGSGRCWAQMVPQMLPNLSDSLRRGRLKAVTPTSGRVLELLQVQLRDLPERVQRERLVAYSLTITTLMAERAHQIEVGGDIPLDAEEFLAQTVDVLVGGLLAPSTVRDRREHGART